MKTQENLVVEMKPKRVPTSNFVFSLPGGNEDNDLWVQRTMENDRPIIISVWELQGYERIAIAEGATIELRIWGEGMPPVSLSIGESLKSRKNEE
jgi:hypothetical protein